MKYKQKFHRGDLVRVAGDLGPSMSHFSGKGEEAIVMGSYADEYGGNDYDNEEEHDVGSDNLHEYTLFLKDQGECSWYDESQLTLIRHVGMKGIREWKKAAKEKHTQRADLSWIVANWARFKEEKSYPGASLEELMRRIGITNPWGAHGEGITWHTNAMQTVALLDAALTEGDMAKILLRFETVKKIIFP